MSEPSASEAQPVEQMHALHPGVQKVWRVSGVISAVVTAALFVAPDIILSRELNSPLPPGVVSAVLFVLLLVWYQALVGAQYRRWRYAVRRDDVLVQYGVVWRMRRCIPRVRVQHVDISSGPIDRMLGLVHIALFTAGNMGAVATIPGLTPQQAEAMRDELLGAARTS